MKYLNTVLEVLKYKKIKMTGCASLYSASIAQTFPFK